MQHNINTTLWCSLSENGFSLDELVVQLKVVYNTTGFSGIIELLLLLTQETLIVEASSKPKRHWCACSEPRYVLNGSYHRKLKTSLGEISLPWRRIKCTSCDTTMVPLKTFLGLNKHQYKSNELEQIVVDAVMKDSYRRAVETVGSQGFISVPHSTAHRWVMQTDCDELDYSKRTQSDSEAVQVFADGTKFKGLSQDGEPFRGDLKVVIGVDQQGEVFPVGSWAGESWGDVKTEIKGNIEKFPKDSVLIADGEIAIENAFVDMVDDVQRCHWHVARDLYHTMWQNGGTSKESKPLQKALVHALAIEIPKTDFRLVSEGEKDAIEEQMDIIEDLIDDLIIHLEVRQYQKAADYLAGAKKGMFGYVKRWLRTGIICPRASSLIERVMRELGKRLKKVAYNWSDKGCAKMARIILRKFISIAEWDEYWKNKLKLNGNVKMGISEISSL